MNLKTAKIKIVFFLVISMKVITTNAFAFKGVYDNRVTGAKYRKTDLVIGE